MKVSHVKYRKLNPLIRWINQRIWPQFYLWSMQAKIIKTSFRHYLQPFNTMIHNKFSKLKVYFLNWSEMFMSLLMQFVTKSIMNSSKWPSRKLTKYGQRLKVQLMALLIILRISCWNRWRMNKPKKCCGKANLMKLKITLNDIIYKSTFNCSNQLYLSYKSIYKKQSINIPQENNMISLK